MASSISNSITKKVEVSAPRSRVWRALTNAKEFGAWFGVALEGDFAAGQPIEGNITSKGYEHVRMKMTVDVIEPERVFSFYWLPYAIDPNVDYTQEKPTLVKFTLDEADGKTQVTVVESGFDRVPLARRAKAFEMNDMGWALQMKNIESYLQDGPK